MGSGGRTCGRPVHLRDLSSDLEVLDGLLNTLTDVLDIREVFDRISQLVQRVLPHDILGIGEFSERGDRMRLHVDAGLAEKPQPFDVPVPDPALILRPWEATIFEDVQTNAFFKMGPAAKAGMKSVLSAPIRFGGRLQAAVNFFSREQGWFAPDDLPVARRIASHIALAMSHERLAEEARQRQALEAHASKLDLLDQSLASLIDTGELKDVMDRISKVTREVLPHDGLALAVMMPDGRHARRYATSGWDISTFPEVMDVPPDFDRNLDRGYDLVDDLSTRTEPLNVLIRKTGFLSVLRVPILLEGKFAAGMAFLSRTTSSYQLRDVQVARRIADRLAVRLEREHGVEAVKRADAATERAAQLELRVRQLTDELDARTGYRRVIGESVPWREVLKKAAQVSAVETTVLLLGESGTGKEVVARFVHRGSARRDGPFVALNCAALPDNLLESELFGYERGAFTGAVQAKPGLIEQAAGGVLFLDEVGEMGLPAQAKFLRVLQEREFQRLGATRVLKADIRVVAATNRDLRAKRLSRSCSVRTSSFA
jgi:transcriptional regulator with GAF, ATPase, and Fis domain